MQQSSTIGPVGTTASGRQTFSITGRVLDESTSQAIDGARVRLTGFVGLSLQEIYVDTTGYFRFSDLSRGTYYVSASASGYEEKQEMVQLVGAPMGGVFLYLRPKAEAGPPLLVEPLDVDQALIPKDARKAFERGVAAVRRQKLRDALPHFERALELYPKYVSAWNAKGLTHLKLVEVESARSCFERAVELNANAATPRVFLGGIYNADHRYTEARDHLLRAVQLNPKSWLGHFELSRSYWALKDLDKVEEHIILAHDHLSGIPQVHMMRANLYAARGEYRNAVAEMDDFLKLVPAGPLADYVRERRAVVAARVTPAEPASKAR